MLGLPVSEVPLDVKLLVDSSEESLFPVSSSEESSLLVTPSSDEPPLAVPSFPELDEQSACCHSWKQPMVSLELQHGSNLPLPVYLMQLPQLGAAGFPFTQYFWAASGAVASAYRHPY